MIRIDRYVCKCGRLRGSATLRCSESSHAKANERAMHERLKEDAIRRIVGRFGPAAGKVFCK